MIIMTLGKFGDDQEMMSESSSLMKKNFVSCLRFLTGSLSRNKKKVISRLLLCLPWKYKKDHHREWTIEKSTTTTILPVAAAAAQRWSRLRTKKFLQNLLISLPHFHISPHHHHHHQCEIKIIFQIQNWSHADSFSISNFSFSSVPVGVARSSRIKHESEVMWRQVTHN